MITIDHKDCDGEYKDETYVFVFAEEIIMEVINMMCCPIVGEFVVANGREFEVVKIVNNPLTNTITHYLN